MKHLAFLLTPLLAIGLLADTALGQVRDSGTALSERRPVHARSGGGAEVLNG